VDESRRAGVGRVAELAGDVLGWDDARRAQEVAEWRERVAADRRAERAPTDAAALAARAAGAATPAGA